MTRIACIVAALAITLLFCSCVSVGDNDSQNLPWSAPAGWENSTLGVPMSGLVILC